MFASRKIHTLQIRRQKAQISHFPSQIFLGTVMVPKFVDEAIESSSQIGFSCFITAILCIIDFFGYHHGTQNFHISKVYIPGFLQPCRTLFYHSQIQTYNDLNFNNFERILYFKKSLNCKRKCCVSQKLLKFKSLKMWIWE